MVGVKEQPTKSARSAKAGKPKHERAEKPEKRGFAGKGRSQEKKWKQLLFFSLATVFAAVVLPPMLKGKHVVRPGLIGEYEQPGFYSPVELGKSPLPENPSILVQGLLATQDLQEGDQVLAVPLDRVLYKETFASEAIRLCAKCDAMSQLVLALAFEKRKPQPVFQSYIAALPVNATNWAGFGATHVRFINAREEDAFSNIMLGWLEPVLKAGQGMKPPLQESEALWALSIVQSRAFSITLRDRRGAKEKFQALIPALDMVNHHVSTPGVQPPLCSRATGVCKLMVAPGQAIAQGKHIWGDYGDYANMDLMIRYGFTMAGNKWGVKFQRKTVLKEKNPWLGEVLHCSSYFLDRGWQLRSDEPSLVDRETLRCLAAERAFKNADEARLHGSGLNSAECLSGTGTCGGGPWEELLKTAVEDARREVRISCMVRRRSLSKQLGVMQDMQEQNDPVSKQLAAAGLEELRTVQTCERNFGSLGISHHDI